MSRTAKCPPKVESETTLARGIANHSTLQAGSFFLLNGHRTYNPVPAIGCVLWYCSEIEYMLRIQMVRR